MRIVSAHIICAAILITVTGFDGGAGVGLIEKMTHASALDDYFALGQADSGYFANSKLLYDQAVDYTTNSRESEIFASYATNGGYGGIRSEYASFLSKDANSKFTIFFKDRIGSGENYFPPVNKGLTAEKAVETLVGLGFSTLDLGSPVVKEIKAQSNEIEHLREPQTVSYSVFFFRKISGLEVVPSNRIVVTLNHEMKVVKILGFWDTIEPELECPVTEITRQRLLSIAAAALENDPRAISADRIEVGMWFKLVENSGVKTAKLVGYAAIPSSRTDGIGGSGAFIEFELPES